MEDRESKCSLRICCCKVPFQYEGDDFSVGKQIRNIHFLNVEQEKTNLLATQIITVN